MSKIHRDFVSVRDANDREIERLPAEHVPLDYPDMPWRADPATGQASDGRIFSAVYSRLFISDDEGRSWKPRSIQFDGFNGCCGFGVLPDDNGRVEAASRTRLSPLLLLYQTPPDEREVSGIAVARSTDGGISWEPGEPFAIAPYTSSPGADGNKFCMLPDGTIIVAVCLRYGDGIKDQDGVELPLEKKGIRDYVYRSTDGGRTWGGQTLLVSDSSESNFLSLGGGRVLAAIRRQRWFSRPADPPEFWQQTGGTPEMIYKHLFLADSDDGGRIWENLRQWTKVIGDCPGELVRLSDGRVVLIYCHRYPYEHGDISARVSRDEGKTWAPERYVVSVGCGYPGSVVLADDTIVTVCGNTRLKFNGSNAEPWKMHAVRFRLPD